MSTRNSILVTSATGNVGRHVVHQLSSSHHHVRALTRSPETARMPAGVEVIAGSQTDTPVLRENLHNVRAAFLVWSDFNHPSDAQDTVDTLAEQVDRIVFLSSAAIRDNLDEQTDLIGRVHRDIELAIERSGVEWTFLRPHAFAANTLELAPAVSAGEVAKLAFADAPTTLIDERDIAEIAVIALTEDGHVGAKYELTGPETLTPVQQLEFIGQQVGKRLDWEEKSPQELKRDFIDMGLEPAQAESELAIFGELIQQASPTTDTVFTVTGHPARTYRDWLALHATDFTDPVPEVTRADAGLVLMSTWTLDTPPRQRAAAEAAIEPWRHTPLPAGMLSYHVMIGTDGATLLHYSQWKDEAALERRRATDPPERVTRIDEEVPGIRRNGLTVYQLHDTVPRMGSARTECVEREIITVPDSATAQAFIDTLHKWLTSNTEVSSAVTHHFHISGSGNEITHLVELPNQDFPAQTVAKWSRSSSTVAALVKEFPGVAVASSSRFLPYRGITQHQQTDINHDNS